LPFLPSQATVPQAMAASGTANHTEVTQAVPRSAGHCGRREGPPGVSRLEGPAGGRRRGEILLRKDRGLADPFRAPHGAARPVIPTPSAPSRAPCVPRRPAPLGDPDDAVVPLR